MLKEEQKESLFLDPIKFRYSTETIVEEPEEIIPQESAEEEAPKAHRSRRRNRKPAKPAEEKKPTQEQNPAPAEKPKQAKAVKPQPQKEAKPQPQKEAKPQAAGVKAEGASDEVKKNKSRRRPHYRHRKPKTSGGSNE